MLFSKCITHGTFILTYRECNLKNLFKCIYILTIGITQVKTSCQKVLSLVFKMHLNFKYMLLLLPSSMPQNVRRIGNQRHLTIFAIRITELVKLFCSLTTIKTHMFIIIKVCIIKEFTIEHDMIQNVNKISKREQYLTHNTF